jgi:hypothetical protein
MLIPRRARNGRNSEWSLFDLSELLTPPVFPLSRHTSRLTKAEGKREGRSLAQAERDRSTHGTRLILGLSWGQGRTASGPRPPPWSRRLSFWLSYPESTVIRPITSPSHPRQLPREQVLFQPTRRPRGPAKSLVEELGLIGGAVGVIPTPRNWCRGSLKVAVSPVSRRIVNRQQTAPTAATAPTGDGPTGLARNSHLPLLDSHHRSHSRGGLHSQRIFGKAVFLVLDNPP